MLSQRWQREYAPYLFYFLLSVLLVAASLATYKPVAQLRLFIDRQLLPLYHVQQTLSGTLADGAQSLEDHVASSQHVRYLRQSYARLLPLSREVDFLRRENARLKEMLGLAQTVNHPRVSAEVIHDERSPFARSILINAGAKSGIEKGHTVINEQGVIGRIAAVEDNFSRVLLMQDYALRLPVWFVNSRVRGLVRGTNGPYLELIILEKDQELVPDESVVTSGIEGLMPPDLPVGTLQVDEEGKISIVPIFTPGTLKTVTVIKHPVKAYLAEDPDA